MSATRHPDLMLMEMSMKSAPMMIPMELPMKICVKARGRRRCRTMKVTQTEETKCLSPLPGAPNVGV